MAQSYSQFTYEDVEALGVRIQRVQLFPTLPTPVAPSDWLKETLAMNNRRPMATEKAKSELIISPILSELVARNNDAFTFFSGYNFDVEKKKGLKGHVDFILSKDALSPVIEAPVFCIVEAKNDNLDVGVPQCTAEMVAAQTFNQRKGRPTTVVHGAVTYGLAWQFLRLENESCSLDTDIFFLNQLPQLLGILQWIVDYPS